MHFHTSLRKMIFNGRAEEWYLMVSNVVLFIFL